MARRIALALSLPALAAAAALGGILLVADAERDAAEEVRSSYAAAVAAYELERTVADLERGARGFVLTGRERFLEPYTRARAALSGIHPRIDAYVERELEPVIALARRDRREARIAVARGDGQQRADELRADIHARGDARVARAAAADERAAARADDLRLIAYVGGGAVLALALLSGVLLARWVRRRLAAGELAARRLEAHRGLGAAAGEPDDLLRELADALSAELGALYVRTGEGPFRLAAVRGLEGRQLGDELRPGEGLAGRAAAERRPVAASYGDAALAVRAHGREVAVAHELHLPLALHGSSVGVVTLARVGGGPFDAADRELAEMLAPHAAAALSSAITRLAVPEVPHEVDLVRLARESVEAARPEADERGIEVSLALESVPRCAGDPHRISLALDDVVSRAMEAARPGGRIDARLFPHSGAAVIELTVDPGRGLELARSVFEDYGGAVVVEGSGAAHTVFRVELPLRASKRA